MFGFFNRDKSQSDSKLTGKSEGFECGKHIDIPDLASEFGMAMAFNGIVNERLEDSFVQLVQRPFSNGAFSPFREIVDMCSEFNTSNDLVKKHADGTASSVESLIFMANAYAQRTATIAEMLRTGVDNTSYEHFVNTQFKFAQVRTFQNKDFQILAAAYSMHFIKEIDCNINTEGLKPYMACVMSRKSNIYCLWESSAFIEMDQVYKFLDYCADTDSVSIELVNSFIISHKKTKQ